MEKKDPQLIGEMARAIAFSRTIKSDGLFFIRPKK
jgi:hypothetical protein